MQVYFMLPKVTEYSGLSTGLYKMKVNIFMFHPHMSPYLSSYCVLLV